MREYIEFSVDDINEEFNIHWDSLFWKYLNKRLDFGAGIIFVFVDNLFLADSSAYTDVTFLEKMAKTIKTVQNDEIDKKYYKKFE